MKRIIFHLLIAGVLIIGVTYADDYISDVKTPEGNTQLNEELRQLRKDIETDVLWETDGGDVELETADDIDFQQKEAQQLVIENRTSDPSSPVAGQIWFRSDL